MDLQLTDKKAIVTGASRGIGRAIARQLALEAVMSPSVPGPQDRCRKQPLHWRMSRAAR